MKERNGYEVITAETERGTGVLKTDGGLLNEKTADRDGERGWVWRREGGSLNFNHHIFSLVRDIIYTNPPKSSGAECVVPTPSQQPEHFSLLSPSVRFHSVPFFTALSLGASAFPSIFTGLTPITVDFRFGDSRVCYFEDCTVLVFAA